MKHLIFKLSILVALLSQVGAFASDRVAWFSDSSYLVQTIAKDWGWIESAGGQELYYFKEVQRNDSYVELYDSQRQIYMALTQDTMFLKGPTETAYRAFKKGHFDNRRLWFVTTPEGTLLQFTLIGGGLFRFTSHTKSGQQTSKYLRELSRESDRVRLLDPQENVIYVLFDTELYKGASSGGAIYLSEGRGRWQ